MTYTPLLHPRRGFMIEKAQPFTTYDIELVKQILDENDEVVIGIGNAGVSHELGLLMTAGERVDLTDTILRAENIDPNRYILIPIENALEATQWVAEVLMMTPRWDTLYTRNFKNASMFATFQKQYGYEIKTIAEQKPDVDYFASMARAARNHQDLEEEITKGLFDVSEVGFKRLRELGILERARVIYNRENVGFSNSDNISTKGVSQRALFLGGLQPFTGVYESGNGHFGAVLLALQQREQVVIAVGSAQQSYKEDDPLTAGKRIEIIRYALQMNGIDASRFYTIPIKDIAANSCYAPKVISFCPEFDAVLAGNDWTKQLFGEGNLETISLERSGVIEGGTNVPISATRVRRSVRDIIMKNHRKDEVVSDKTIYDIEEALVGMIDSATLAKLKDVGFYDTMHFLAYAKD